MEWLNYHHLLYYYLTVREGSVTGAARRLRLAQPTVTGQIRQLEEAMGGKLLERAGRGVRPTELGRTVYGYAEEIFRLGGELQDVARGRPAAGRARMVVGVADVLPKLLVYRFLQAAIGDDVELVVKQDRLERLVADLTLHAFDLVLADSPLGPSSKVRAFNHPLGESGLSFVAAPSIRRQLKGPFPRCLDEAPFLFPGEHTTVRRSLDYWFETEDVSPVRIAEIHDSAVVKAFGQAGAGVFVVPTVVEDAVCEQYRVEALGRVDELRERFYAITVERRIKHPAVQAVTEAAKEFLL